MSDVFSDVRWSLDNETVVVAKGSIMTFFCDSCCEDHFVHEFHTSREDAMHPAQHHRNQQSHFTSVLADSLKHKLSFTCRSPFISRSAPNGHDSESACVRVVVGWGGGSGGGGVVR